MAIIIIIKYWSTNYIHSISLHSIFYKENLMEVVPHFFKKKNKNEKKMRYFKISASTEHVEIFSMMGAFKRHHILLQEPAVVIG